MKLPHASEAIVPEAKITGYLLSATHPEGRHKAAFFRQFGFRVEEWWLFAEALRTQAIEYDVANTRDSPFGTRYTVEGVLETPQSRRPLVRSVWVVETGNRRSRASERLSSGKENE
jgi:hypothetical protein